MGHIGMCRCEGYCFQAVYPSIGYMEIRQLFLYFRYLCIFKIMSQLRNKQFDRVMESHINKIAKLLHREFDVDTHINNISSYKLSFFLKLVRILCRGLKFSLPQDALAEEIQASFEKAYWRVERT